MKKKKGKAANSTAPREGKRKDFGPQMKPLFGVTAKKPEPDNPVQKRGRAARMARLEGKRI